MCTGVFCLKSHPLKFDGDSTTGGEIVEMSRLPAGWKGRLEDEKINSKVSIASSGINHAFGMYLVGGR